MADEATELTGKYFSRRSKGKCRFRKREALGPEISRLVNEWDRSSNVPSSDDNIGTSDPIIHHFSGSILIITTELLTIALLGGAYSLRFK
tara:strand:+ start:187 stop:456 length:270 start_codon:yes stop_codon:yes gene_type:complete